MKDTEDLSDLITRVAVIDRRANGGGRLIDATDCRVELDYQDQARTLKVFISDRP